jgi:hypothetical protein
MKNLKFAGLALIATLAGTYANLASAQTANWQTTANVEIFSSAKTTLEINAFSLIDNSQLVGLQYGFLQLDKVIKIKSIVAPKELVVSMNECSLGTDANGNASIKLIFNLESTTSYGNFPVLITLENTQTGQVTTLAIQVAVQ